jgi:hypothetical protein
MSPWKWKIYTTLPTKINANIKLVIEMIGASTVKISRHMVSNKKRSQT